MHSQLRPAIRLRLPKLSITGYYAFVVSDPFLISERSTNPFFYTNEEGYYYTQTITQTWSEAMNFFGGEMIWIPFNNIRLKAEGTYAEKEIYRFSFGAELQVFDCLSIGADWQKAKVGGEGRFSRWGNYEALGVNVSVLLGAEAGDSFNNLTHRKIIRPAYPLVIEKVKIKKIVEKIAEALTATLSVTKHGSTAGFAGGTEYMTLCPGDTVDVTLLADGGVLPLTYVIDFGDGTVVNLASAKHTYMNIGKYCIVGTVTDASGHTIQRCFCLEVVPCEKSFWLKIIWCDGINGNPRPGTTFWKEGEVVDYKYFLKNQKDFEGLIVTLDGVTVDPNGSIVMNQNHTVKVCSNQICHQAQILFFEVSPNIVKKGEEVTIAWATQDASTVTLNGEVIDGSGSKKIIINEATEFTLVASNECPSEVSSTKGVTVEEECSNVMIESFVSSADYANPGDVVTLSWSVKNADVILLNGEPVSATGTKTVTVLSTTTYTLEAANKCSAAYSSVTVNVCNKVIMVPENFTVNPQMVEPGEKVTVIWTTPTNADKVTIYKDGTIVSTALSGVMEFIIDNIEGATFDMIAENSCSSEHVRTTVSTQTGEICKLCESVFFHSDGSSVLVKNNRPGHCDDYFDWSLWNLSDSCAFQDITIKWKVEGEGGGTPLIASGQFNAGDLNPSQHRDYRWSYDHNHNKVRIYAGWTMIAEFSLTVPSGISKVKVTFAVDSCGGSF
ncbi:MAG: PKD domain-containing protein [Candidatus Nanoarchaeia archaeon]|nr:PKD domain-containing protein [Candidatus Nanoarchaeia archaeon]